MIGDARTPPALLAAAGFQGIAVIGEFSSCGLFSKTVHCVS